MRGASQMSAISGAMSAPTQRWRSSRSISKRLFSRPLEQHQPLRAELHRLPADFRADAAAGAGDQHAFAGQESLQFGRVQIDRRPAEQIGQIGSDDGRTACAAARAIATALDE